MSDPVLHALRPLFLARNFHVLLYNSRPSLTGVSEGQDLQELVAGTIKELGGHVDRVVIMGYSHGSLIASLHPLLPDPIKTYHILLCYPMGVRGLITFFNSGTFETALHTLIQEPKSSLLVLYGDKDQFTSLHRYERWVEKLNNEARGQLSTVQVESGDHFWHGRAGEEMCSAVGHWLDEL